MEFSELKDRKIIYEYLVRDRSLHLYAIGDLDPFFFRYTRWFAGYEKGRIDSLILLFTGLKLPCLLALSDRPDTTAAVIRKYADDLPRRCYAHFSPGIEPLFDDLFDITSHGEHYKMALNDYGNIPETDTAKITLLDHSYLDRINRLYSEAYPSNWFEPRMLDTGQYYGIIESSRIIAIGGVHVYSPQYRVAALGNIAVHPDYRGKGLGKIVTAACCNSLKETTDMIGLNVSIKNIPAISLYKSLGFEIRHRYYERIMVKR